MRRLPLILVVAMAALATDGVRADLRLASPSQSAAAPNLTYDARPSDVVLLPSAGESLCQRSVTPVSPGRVSDLWSVDVSAVGPVANGLSKRADSHGSQESDDPVILEIQPPPSSFSLFLSAMLSVGGWQLLRSARHWHLATPDWYHTGGPAQIGHVTPLNLDFDSLALCCFEQPGGERPFLYRVRRDRVPSRDTAGYLLLAAPRGPPPSA